MNAKQSIYQNSPTKIQALLVLCGLLMVGASLYMTKHYFNVQFPDGLASSSFCNINSYFNCDLSSSSAAASWWGVPSAFWGLLVGVFIFVGYLFYSPQLEGTLFFLLAANGVGCLALALYSLLALKGLCPVCCLYYVGSWAALFLFYRYSSYRRASLKVLGVYGIFFLLSSVGMASVTREKLQKRKALSHSLINQFRSLPNLGRPEKDSPYILHAARQNFTDAPIRMTIFSDFECPACRSFADVLPQIVEKYSNRINVQYFFFPLDSTCNQKMRSHLHPLACKAAYLASCVPSQRFLEVHDFIFEHQEELSNQWLDDYADQLGVSDCLAAPETKQKVVQMVQMSDPFRIRSTPTILINGIKIEGVLPFDKLSVIFDAILEK